MDTKLGLITQRSARDSKAKFDALLHHINKGSLAESFQGLDGTKAVGVDGVRKEDYTMNLEDNLQSLAKKQFPIPKVCVVHKLF